jgi:hypothetical protein
MKTVVIKTVDGKVVAMLVQQPEQTDQSFEELCVALLLTIANDTGLQLTRETTKGE